MGVSTRRASHGQAERRRLLLFNKPFQVMCQFTDRAGRATLADFIAVKEIYPAGRLDYDSEGLLLLTNWGYLQHLIADPQHKLPKRYLVQVEGEPTAAALAALAAGVEIQGQRTRPAQAKLVAAPAVWPRVPPIRTRKSVPTSWIELAIREGRNRQVRRMTAAVGHPTLRLIRTAIGPWQLDDLQPGQAREVACPPDEAAARRLLGAQSRL